MAKDTILITGGATGIGLALAKRYIAAGNTVIAVGRRADKLNDAKQAVPGLKTIGGDVSSEKGRIALIDTVLNDFPEVNFLFNNAGQMRFAGLISSVDFKLIEEEITTNLIAPIHLSSLIIPHLEKQQNPKIAFTTSGLAFVPLAASSVYSASKAGLHSFILSLRFQLKDSDIKVIEVAPPHVNTDLGTPGSNTAGLPLDEFADAAFQQLLDGKLEVTVGTSATRSQGSRTENDQYFEMMNTAWSKLQ